LTELACIGPLGGSGHGFLHRAPPIAEFIDHFQRACRVKAVSFAEAEKMFRLHRVDRQIGRLAKRESQGPVLGIEGGGDQIVGWSQPQPFTPMEHREVLEVRVGVTGQDASENPTIESQCLDGCAAGGVPDEGAHVVIGRVVLVAAITAGTAAQELIEFLEVNPSPRGQPVEPFDEQRPAIDSVHLSDLKGNHLIAG